LYVGVTNDLLRRVAEHRQGLIPGFTKRYGLTRLVYFEVYDDIQLAIQREHNIKHYSRRGKYDSFFVPTRDETIFLIV
jgi:putative endonuclease